MRKLLVNTKEGPDLKGVFLSQKVDFLSTPHLVPTYFPLLQEQRWKFEYTSDTNVLEILTPVYWTPVY